MKKNRIIFLMMILQSCFLAPQESVKREIRQGDIFLKWVEIIGILDQNYPDYILIQKGKQADTICRSHNIADLRIREDVIIVGFYGTPENYSESIIVPEKILGCKIEIDTSFVKKMEVIESKTTGR